MPKQQKINQLEAIKIADLLREIETTNFILDDLVYIVEKNLSIRTNSVTIKRIITSLNLDYKKPVKSPTKRISRVKLERLESQVKFLITLLCESDILSEADCEQIRKFEDEEG